MPSYSKIIGIYEHFHWIQNIICFRLLLLLCGQCSCLDLVASISQRGIKGEIKFSGDEAGAVLATADLEVAPGVEGDYTWGIYEFPIDYTKVCINDNQL